MAPALLGVSVAQISMLINTQIASHVGVGAVSWLTYADRLMEFPTALLGVAMGVVLLPQLSSAQGRGDTQAYSGMLDWGLRLVLLLALPCAVALLVFAQPLVAVLFHYGAFTAADVAQTARAVHGLGRRPDGPGGREGAGAGASTPAKTPHAGEDRHRRAGGHAGDERRLRALDRLSPGWRCRSAWARR